jgi:hypothetical protein
MEPIRGQALLLREPDSPFFHSSQREELPVTGSKKKSGRSLLQRVKTTITKHTIPNKKAKDTTTPKPKTAIKTATLQEKSHVKFSDIHCDSDKDSDDSDDDFVIPLSLKSSATGSGERKLPKRKCTTDSQSTSLPVQPEAAEKLGPEINTMSSEKQSSTPEKLGSCVPKKDSASSSRVIPLPSFRPVPQRSLAELSPSLFTRRSERCALHSLHYLHIYADVS